MLNQSRLSFRFDFNRAHLENLVMGDAGKLKRRYAQARRRIKKETIAIERARSRRHYWSRVAHAIEVRLDLLKNGQTELDFERKQ